MLQIWTPTGRSPQGAWCSRTTGAPRSAGRRFWHDEAGQRHTWVHGPACSSPWTSRSKTPTCRRPGGRGGHSPGRQGLTGLRPACVPAGRKGTARFAAGSQGSDLPTSRRSGRAQSASPPAHRAQTYRHPAVESSVGHVSRPGAARPARASEAMTLKRLRSEETRQPPSSCPGVPRPHAVPPAASRRPPRGCSRHEPCGVDTTY